jgi:hypothetical protein
MAIGISRATLPQEFYDITSSKLLTQPEPQYLYADLMLRSLGTSLNMPDAIGLPGRQITGQGADYTTPTQDRLMLEGDILTENIFEAKVNFRGGPGTSVRFNRPKYTNWSVTEADRRLTPGQVIGTTGVSLSSEQALVNLHRYAGPYSSATAGSGSIQPIAVEAFDAEMGVHNLLKVAGLHLIRDFHRFCNAQIVALNNLAASTIYPEGMTADNDATVANQFPLDFETMTRTARTMDDANLPVLPDGRRIFVATPTSLAQLRQDRAFVDAAKEDNSKNPLFYRYTQLRYTLPEWHVFVSNQLTTADNSSSIAIHSNHAIAPGGLGCGMGRAPMVRNSTNDNYGESVPVVWIADLAFTMLNNTFTYLVKNTQSAT